MDDEQIIRKANRAAIEYLETEEAFAAVRQALINKWAGSELGASAERERLFFSIQSLDAVQTALRGVIEDGKVARHVADLQAQLNPR